MKRVGLGLAAIGALALLSGCAAQKMDEIVLSTKSPIELRSMQSRAFDTADRPKTLRTVIATLQDLGYAVDKVEPAAGTVSATKLAALRMTVTVYPRGEAQTMVRSNALVKVGPARNQVDDPAFYQQLFFEPLSKAMFLTALQVQDGGAEETPPKAASEPGLPATSPGSAANQ